MLFNGGQDPLAGRQAGGTASGVVGLRTRSPASSASAVAALRGGAFAQVDANSANPATGLGQARTEPGRDRLDGTIRGRRGIDLGVLIAPVRGSNAAYRATAMTVVMSSSPL